MVGFSWTVDVPPKERVALFIFSMPDVDRDKSAEYGLWRGFLMSPTRSPSSQDHFSVKWVSLWPDFPLSTSSNFLPLPPGAESQTSMVDHVHLFVDAGKASRLAGSRGGSSAQRLVELEQRSKAMVQKQEYLNSFDLEYELQVCEWRVNVIICSCSVVWCWCLCAGS